jgi:hypothetical protein
VRRSHIYKIKQEKTYPVTLTCIDLESGRLQAMILQAGLELQVLTELQLQQSIDEILQLCLINLHKKAIALTICDRFFQLDTILLKSRRRMANCPRSPACLTLISRSIGFSRSRYQFRFFRFSFSCLETSYI